MPKKAANIVWPATILLLLNSPVQVRAGAHSVVMRPRTWLEIPNTRMSRVYPSMSKYPNIRAVTGPKGVVNAWGGAVLDTKRNQMILWGGGHADYYGNELYRFDINKMKWSRITDPFPNPVKDKETNSDGTPNSRHTYNGLAYIAHADRFFGKAGSLAGVGFAKCDKTWVFDLAHKKWEDRKPSGQDPKGGYDCNCVYDPRTRLVWWNKDRYLWSYDYDRNVWTKAPIERDRDKKILYPYISMGALDTRRGIYFGISCRGTKQNLFAYAVRQKKVTQKVWIIDSKDVQLRPAMGMDYDPAADKLVLWGTADKKVYVMDVEKRTWHTIDAPGAPKPTQAGMYGRWRYIPSLNAFIAITDGSKNVHFFKLTADAGKRR